MSDSPQTIYLKDYKVPEYLIKTVDLFFKLDEDKTVVTSEVHFYKNSSGQISSPEPAYVREHFPNAIQIGLSRI